jgi:hypothetical protein
VLTAERFVPTGERFAGTSARFGRTGTKPEPTCASIARIDEKERRSRSFGPTVVKSGPIDARCLVTGVSCDRIEAIYVATDATSGEIAAMRAIK